MHDVYFTYTGPAGADLFEIDSWAFEGQAEDVTSPVVEVSGLEDGGDYGDSQDLTIGWTATDTESGVKSTTATLDDSPSPPARHRHCTNSPRANTR